MTREEQAARRWIKHWCSNRRIEVRTLRHVYPLCYVIGYASPGCLILARPWKHAEPHLKTTTRENPLALVHLFDRSLKPGDWCTTGYITSDRGGEIVAVPA